MLIATILGVLLIPMLYVAVERVVGARLPTVTPEPGSPPLTPQHGHGSH
jgi:hypothetical protein